MLISNRPPKERQPYSVEIWQTSTDNVISLMTGLNGIIQLKLRVILQNNRNTVFKTDSMVVTGLRTGFPLQDNKT